MNIPLLVDWWIPPAIYTDVDRLARVRAGIVMSAFLGCIGLVMAATFWYEAAPWQLPATIVVCSIFPLSVPAIIRAGRSGPFLGVIGAGLFGWLILVVALCRGPDGVLFLSWFVAVPFVAFFTAGRNAGLAVFAATLAVYAGCLWLHQWGLWPDGVYDERSFQSQLLDHMGPLVSVFVIGVGYENAKHRALQLLAQSNEAHEAEVEEHQSTKEALHAAHKQLVRNAHLAGMAEVATGVIHNLGNAVNSVSVSSSLIAQHLQRCRTPERVTQISTALKKVGPAQLAAFALALSKAVETDRQNLIRVQIGLRQAA